MNEWNFFECKYHFYGGKLLDSQKVAPETVREAQNVMLKMLKQIDRICRENNLFYWLDSGTLLGAVRHKGFIPWDDDVDICMMRADYEKFIKIVQTFLPDDMVLQNFDTDKYFVCCLNRIVYKNSLYLSNDEPILSMLGIYIDIFPMDKLSNKKGVRRLFRKIIRKIYSWCSVIVRYRQRRVKCPVFSYHNLLDNIKIIIVNKFFRNAKFPNLHTAEFIEKKLRKWMTVRSDKKDDFAIGFGLGLIYRVTFSYDTVFPLKKMAFEDGLFYVPNDCDRYLRTWYGDTYMQLPKEEDRQHHAIKIIPDLSRIDKSKS
jgi:lipopolysaccharide cholinephosphotransferase